MKTLFKYLCFMTFALMLSCGYKPMHGKVPGGGEVINVPLVVNQTACPDIAGPLTSTLRKRLAKSGLNVVRSGKPRLEVTVISVTVAAGMLDQVDGRLIPLDSIETITAEARIIGLAGDNIGPVKFSASGRSFAGDNVMAADALQRRRIPGLLDDLAEAIALELFEL